MSEYNTYMNMAPENPAVAAVKKTGGSALFLIATITYTIIVLLSLISAFMPSSLTTYADLLYEITYDVSVYDTIYAMDSGSVIGALIGSIPGILIAVAFWMIYGACKSKKPRVSTGGFTMINVFQIINLVLMSILLALVCVLMVIFAFLAYELNSSEMYGFAALAGVATTIYIFALIFIVLILVLSIIYYAKLVGTVRVIKKAANGIVSGNKISMFVIVINFILIGFSVIGLIGNLIAFSFMPFLINLLTITFNILITIALIQMRGKLNQIVLDNTMNATGSYYNTGAYENYNTGSYNNFNTGSVPPVQPQYQQPQAPQYGQPQQYQQQAPQYGQPQQYQQQAPQYGQPQQYQQQAPQQNQQQAPQQNQQPWNGGQQ
ncbi:MAG: hypothetical protein IKL38_06940 [Firmicutes bacterium]|nr:hypothetical protein [Bacillota bacterium]